MGDQPWSRQQFEDWLRSLDPDLRRSVADEALRVSRLTARMSPARRRRFLLAATAALDRETAEALAIITARRVLGRDGE